MIKGFWKRAFQKRVVIPVCVVVALLALSPFAINQVVVASAKDYIVTEEEAAGLDADCILVLGCLVYDAEHPSSMLQDRLNVGISLYQAGAAPKLLMSGDHGRVEYDEVNTMKLWAMNQSVPPEDVFMDHAGFSTYESMYRARDVFQAQRIVIVTQEFHLSRAVYVARALGLDAYGVASSERVYGTEKADNSREFLARVKDFFTAIFKPAPTYLGDPIPVSGNGNLTNDKPLAASYQKP